MTEAESSHGGRRRLEYPRLEGFVDNERFRIGFYGVGWGIIGV